ncbi:hypothetical protein Slin15195_G097220 [Septoria linicola]|uniref:Uncharacterized protein n=1 Tax=Septoria linicola TaxID=215465 RepID=A0A9Q9EPD1_9PEZI|nr:hypothetical protein Slin15195_G097220 [Septoria linicola]
MSTRTFALDDSDNDVGVALNHLGYSFSTILACYDRIVAVQCRDFESHYTEVPRGSSVKQFLSFLWQDAVLLNIATLITTQYLLSMRGRPLHSGEMWHVLHLRGVLLHNINSALSDPIRGVSDQILVAVILFAAHELAYSSVEAYHVHMVGFVQMIDIRGGLAALGRYDPWIEKLIVWHDMNCTKIAGCQPYHLKAKGPSSLKKPSGNADMFRMRNKYKAR